MEIAVRLCAEYLLDPFLPVAYHGQNFWLTQVIACYIVLAVGSFTFYVGTANLTYQLLWVRNKDKYYPDTLKFDLEQQIAHEKSIAFENLPKMAVLMTPFTFGVTRGWSKMYYNIDDYGWGYLFLSIPLFLVFTDFLIYWIHRGLHLPWMYQNVHKPHHTYQYTTPFSSHAFHFVDGWSQGVTYYIFAYCMPFHYLLFIAMFLFVNLWTVMIHDQVDFMSPSLVVLSTGHHTIHHAQFNFNYGQYFTFWDRLCGTYKKAPQTNKLFTGERIIPRKQTPNAKSG